MSFWRHARAVLLLPTMVTVVIPAVIVWWDGADVELVPGLLGGLLIAAGISVVVWTVKLFVSVGRGTLAPWDPTSRLVVRGPYRHVRNPMITGVACIVAGEAALLGSWPVLILLALFAATNTIYMPLVEEPGLRRRFGADYEVYRANVPRWLPRLRPWNVPPTAAPSAEPGRQSPPLSF